FLSEKPGGELPIIILHPRPINRYTTAIRLMHLLTKQELRKVYRERRVGLSAEEFQELNERLVAQMGSLVLHPSCTVHLFLPVAGNKEPDTYAIANWLRQQYTGMRLVLPKTERTSHRMSHLV